MGTDGSTKKNLFESWLYDELWVRSANLGLEPKRESRRTRDREVGLPWACKREGYTLPWLRSRGG